MRRMRLLRVAKLVSRPPSQRLATYGMPTRSACSLTASWHCFFVPTNSTLPPRSAVRRRKSYASSMSTVLFCRSMM